MKIGILGAGRVGQTIASKLVEIGNEVMLGTRHPEKLTDWLAGAGRSIQVGSLAEAAAFGEILINATTGGGSLDALSQAGEPNLSGKILIDLSNPMQYSNGKPNGLFVSNTDSLGEQIQRAYPQARVVKTLNTVTPRIMVNPVQLADGKHDLFISGNDAEAKTQVTQLLGSWFGWQNIIDLGDITTARGPEMYMVLWISLLRKLGGGFFNIKVVH